MDEKLEPQEEEYQVEKVITHLLYEEAFELRGYIVFNPVTGGGEVHSKYVYLVKWLGYPDGDNTWEPEENLVDCTELLSIYKQSHGLPLYHETITRSFNWREPTTSLTQTEVNRRAFKNQERAISTPPLTRDPPPKKRKSKKLHSPIADIDDVDAEYCPTKRKKLVFWTSPGRPPKLVEDGKRKRGPKKGVTAGSAERKKPGRKPRALTSAVEVNKTKKADEEEQVEVIRYVLDTSSRRSRSPMRRLLDARRYSSAERLPERWLKTIEEDATEKYLRMTREKLAKMFTARFAASSENLSRQRKMIVCMREREPSDGEQRLCRVVGSSLLKKFLKENNVSCKLPAPDPPKVQIRPAPEIDCGSSSELHHNLDKIDSEGDRSVVETGVSSEEAMCSLTDLRRLAEEESRADAAAFLKAVRLRDVSLTDDELLVIALSYSELFYKQAIRALKCVGDMCKRLEVIKALVSNVRIRGSSSTPRPNLPSTSSSTLELQLVESDLGRGEWLEAVSHCSPEHWKCRLLYQLISLCSPPEVFMDPSSPFCLKAFLHCMRRGAHCQKLAFVKCGVPYGREAVECDFLGVLVDHSHIAAMQANPRYLFEFIENGFDMSALTAMTVPSLMDVDMSVCAVLTRLIKAEGDNIGSGNKGKFSSEKSTCACDITPEKRNMLVNVCGVISDWESHLSRFVRDNIEKKLLQDPRCEVAFDRAVSPVHTLRVSSSFPGECIVRTMLFANVSMPLLSRMLGMVAQSKSALVLCIYSVTISYVPPAESTMDGCLLPLGVCPRTYPNCTVEEASLHDDFMKYNCILIPDPTSTSSAEWYFVLDVKSLEHISTNSVTLRLKMSAPPDALFLAQFVLVARKELDNDTGL